MFTGIVEEVGEVKSISSNAGFLEFEISCSKVLENTNIGDSIATNGVCLTVKELKKNSFLADVMGETLEKSNLKSFSYGSRVNLERALCLGDRIGGHIVSGHIDGTGRIIDIVPKKDGTWFTITSDQNILKYIIYKGSITIDGISLTVADVYNDKFKVSVIPHTYENTVLRYREINSIVNLECDMIGKYIEKLTCKEENHEKENSITMDFLIQNGF